MHTLRTIIELQSVSVLFHCHNIRWFSSSYFLVQQWKFSNLFYQFFYDWCMLADAMVWVLVCSMQIFLNGDYYWKWLASYIYIFFVLCIFSIITNFCICRIVIWNAPINQNRGLQVELEGRKEYIFLLLSESWSRCGWLGWRIARTSLLHQSIACWDDAWGSSFFLTKISRIFQNFVCVQVHQTDWTPFEGIICPG